MDSAYPKIYHQVKRIPHGCVATYGQIARLAGLPVHARLVGYALHSLPEGMDVPWHRVVNAKGMISMLPDPDARTIQRRQLESEGIVFDRNGRVDLSRYQWGE